MNGDEPRRALDDAYAAIFLLLRRDRPADHEQDNAPAQHTDVAPPDLD